MPPPRVSIVTATYNRSNVLRYAIASVLAQTCSDWELIIIGDACTDDTAEVVAGFGDSRVRFVNLPRNIGEQSGPNNAGVGRAGGSFLAFLNHDDLWAPDHLDVSLAALERSTADLVFSLAAAIVPGHGPVLSNAAPSGRYEPRIPVPASTWVFRRALATVVGPWRSYRECYQAPSQDWLYRAWRAGRELALSPVLTVVSFPSGYRAGSYAKRDEADNRLYFERMRTESDFRERLLTEVALAQAHGEPLALSSTAVRPYLSRAGRNMVRAVASSLGIPPASIHHFLRSPRRGAFIDHLRRRRGLPYLERRRLSR